MRELSRVNTDPQTADFPEAQQFLRSHNQTTSKKEPAAEQKSAKKQKPGKQKPQEQKAKKEKS